MLNFMRAQMHTLKSQLTDRVLRFDGVSEIGPEQIARFLLLGVPASKLRVTEQTPDLVMFNQQVSLEDQIRTGIDEPIQLDMAWQLPKSYSTLDLDEHFTTLYNQVEGRYSLELQGKAIERIVVELEEVKARGMVEFMRTVIFILDELKKNNVVWGVGRGSSCASYLLYLIGLHVVDCVTMEVPMEEFFHS